MSAIEAHATLPDDAHKDLRCCKQCKLVKTAQQVRAGGRLHSCDRLVSLRSQSAAGGDSAGFLRAV